MYLTGYPSQLLDNMEQHMNFPGCTNGGGQFINNTMVNQGHVPVSTLNYCVTSSSERKRQLSDHIMYMILGQD